MGLFSIDATDFKWIDGSKDNSENHIIYTDNQMLPCCGHFMIPNETLDNVTISGCPNGIDWSVIHDGNSVILELEDGEIVKCP